MPYERNLWDWLREQSRPLLAKRSLHLCRVENMVMAGYPDVEGCLNGMPFHIELKGALRPANPETPIRTKWQPGQKPWLKKRWTVGGSCFLLMRVGKGREIKLYMIRGDQVGTVGEITESELDKMSIIPTNSSGICVIERAAHFRKWTGE